MFKQIMISFIAISLLGQTTLSPLSNAYAVDAKYLKVATLDSTLDLSLDSTDKIEVIKTAYQDFKKNVDYKLMSVADASSKFSFTIFAHKITEKDMENFVKEYAEYEEYIAYLNSVEEAKLNLAGEDFTPEEFAQVTASSLVALDRESLRWSGCASLGVGVVLVIAAVVMGVIALGKSKGEAKIRDEFAAKKSRLLKTNENNIYFIENHETEIPRQIDQNERNISSYESRIRNAEKKINSLETSLIYESDEEERSDIRSEISSLESSIRSYESSIRSAENRIDWLENEAINYAIIPGWGTQQLEIEGLRHRLALEENQAELEATIAAIPEEHRQARILGVISGVSLVMGTVLGINGSQDC